MRSNVVDNLSLILQALSLEILFRDFDNGDLMQELREQDINYLQKIISQNNEILDILRKEVTNGRKGD